MDSTPADKPETVILKDGRTLAYARYGANPASGKTPIFYFNGTPGSHLEANLIDEPARKLDIPLIAIERPGFGSSTFQDNRLLLDWPKDVLELADHLSITRFGIIGLSGGGPYVLACLHGIDQDRLVAATIVSGMLPISLGTTGMMWQTRSMFSISYYSTWLAEKMVDLTIGRMLRNTSQEKVLEAMEKQSQTLPQPQADKDAMKQITEDDTLLKAFLGSMTEALRLSSKGAAWEFWLLGSDWKFKLEDVDGERLTLWHGELDVNVPVGMPDKASNLIPGLRYRRMEDEGHVSVIVRHREEILSELMRRL